MRFLWAFCRHASERQERRAPRPAGWVMGFPHIPQTYPMIHPAAIGGPRTRISASRRTAAAVVVAYAAEVTA